MADQYEDGDYRIATLTVDPHDNTTNAVLTVTYPDGTAITPTVSPADGGASWSSVPYLLMGGEVVEQWIVTGTGRSRQSATLLVAPSPTTALAGRVYATTKHYAEYLLKAPPSGARRALAAASRAVDEMLLTAIYDVDTGGMPTNPDIIVALRTATCAQAEYARTIGDANAVGGPQYQSMQIGSVQLARGQTPAGTTTAGRYSPTAWAILQDAGLLQTGPQSS